MDKCRIVELIPNSMPPNRPLGGKTMPDKIRASQETIEIRSGHILFAGFHDSHKVKILILDCFRCVAIRLLLFQ